MADGTFASAKKGHEVYKTKRSKGTKIMVVIDVRGLPLGVDTSSASPHEVTFIEQLLEKRVLRRRVRRLIYDAAADSDPLRILGDSQFYKLTDALLEAMVDSNGSE